MMTNKLLENLKQNFFYSTDSSGNNKTKPDLYHDVQQLALDIVIASSSEDIESQWTAYIKLKELCESNEDTDQNHPFQWEALGDFTTDDEQAIIIYQKALDYAQANRSLEYLASIYLAMAERYFNTRNYNQACNYARKADEAAKSIDDPGLRKVIREFLLTFTSNT